MNDETEQPNQTKVRMQLVIEGELTVEKAADQAKDEGEDQ